MRNQKLRSLKNHEFESKNLLNLQQVLLTSCNILSVGETAFTNLTNLIRLDLSNNRLQYIPTEAFRYFKRPKVCTLSHIHQSKKCFHVVRSIGQLRELALSDNPGLGPQLHNYVFKHLPELVKLEMNSCNLKHVAPRAFNGLDNLKWLHLGGNEFSTLDPSVLAPLGKLQSVEALGFPESIIRN